MIDLHIHSTASDGKLTPKQIIDFAIKKEIPAISITDHDTISGLQEAIDYAKEKNFEFIPGIEISANLPEVEEHTLHIVGLYIDFTNEKLIQLCECMEKAREKQKKKIIKNLNNLGYEITFEELKKESNGGVYGRPHIARILLKKYPQKFNVLQDVFDKLLTPRTKTYVPQEKPLLEEAIKIIHNAGGIAIIAHPGYNHNQEKLLSEFIRFGGDGIEVQESYSRITKREDIIKKYHHIAKEKNLIISGGTDYHSSKNNFDIGDFGLTQEEFRNLKNRYKQIYPEIKIKN